MKTLSMYLLLLVAVTACDKDHAVAVNTPATEAFPNTVGDVWHYVVKDTTIQNINDSLAAQFNGTVTIVGSTILSRGIHATIWQFSYPGRVDSFYVYQSGDTVKFTDGQNFVSRQYIFPFVVGAAWPYSLGPKEVKVIGQADLKLGNDSFPNAYELYGDLGMPDGLFRVHEFFEDHVGFVRKYYNPYAELQPIVHIQDWVLVSYKLK